MSLPPSPTLKMLMDFLREDLQQTCAICWFLGAESTEPHTAIHCPSNLCNIHDPDYVRFRSGLRFPSGVVCFFCCLPYGPPANHISIKDAKHLGTFPGCAHPDVLKPLAWLIWKESQLRQRLQNDGHIPVNDDVSYIAWLTKYNDGVINIHRLVVTILLYEECAGAGKVF